MKETKGKMKVKIPHMVFVDGGSAPRQIHESEAEAVKEAKRLADNHPNRLVKVLRITKQFMGRVNVEPITFEFPEEIPF